MVEGAFENLISSIDQSNIECLNICPGTPITNALVQMNDDVFFVKSDESVDHQLLINIPFNELVKVHHLVIRTNKDDSAPELIKLFINHASLDFGQAESEAPTQVINLTDQMIDNGVIDLRFTKFQNVHKLSLFFEDNRGGAFTRVNGIEIHGTPMQGTDVSKIQKEG